MDTINNIVKKLRENRILQERADYNNFSQEELLKRAKDGDNLAMDTLIKSNKDFIRMMSAKTFLLNADPEDVEQLATIGFWDAVMKYDGSGDFRAFAGMIIKRKLADEVRKAETEKTKINTNAASYDAMMNPDEDSEEPSMYADQLSGSDSKPTPEEEVIGNEGYEAITAFLQEKLSETERQALSLYLKGYKVSEISEELGMKYKSVENAIKRVKDKLSDYLRTRESKKIKESVSCDFSEEEKQILRRALDNIKASDEN